MKLALAGDTMLGRNVGETLTRRARPRELVAGEVVETAGEADLFVVNLECCISERGEPWPGPHRENHFRAPPRAAELLAQIGVSCVTLANNHACDFGPDALLDTFEHLRAAGVRWVGAGADVVAARAPAVFETGGLRLALLGACDHAAGDAATPDRPGVAHADLQGGAVPGWLGRAIGDAGAAADLVVVTPHWGTHMATEPEPPIRAAAAGLCRAGAALVAGHSAHLCQGVEGAVLYDMGDFLNDYAAHIRLRNDLSLLFLVTFDATGPVELEAVPLRLASQRTRLATGRDFAWMRRRFRTACRALGTEVTERDGRLVVRWRE